MPKYALKIPGITPHNAPKNIPERKARSHIKTGGTSSDGILRAVISVAAVPIRYCPGAPILKSPDLKAKDTERPVIIMGVALKSILPIFTPLKPKISSPLSALPLLKMPKKISFTAPRGLGRFALMVDGRCITIQFKDLEVEDEWDSTDVHVTAFPPMEKAGYIFKGWKVEGLSDLYTGTLTEELLNQLHELSFEGAEPIFAEAVFEAILAEDEPEEEESEQEDAEEEMIVIQESAQEVPAQDVPAQTVTTAVATGDSANVYWYGVLLVIAVVGMKKNKIL